jgi:hypothetical protein
MGIPNVPVAFINDIAENGTRTDTCRNCGKNWSSHGASKWWLCPDEGKGDLR